VAGAAAPGVTAAPSKSVPAAFLMRELRAGRPVVVDERATVTGALVLDRAEGVRSVFKCRECTFRGPISAADVTFERTVDLSGATFAGVVDFRGATFRAPALFRAALNDESEDGDEVPATFMQRADFSLAVFDDLATFAGADFEAAALFRDTRFADSTFASTTFSGRVAFERASFRGGTTFNGSEYTARAVFEEADFRGRADFSLAIFDAGAVFTAAQFGNGVSFLAADFTSRALETEAVAFDDAASTKNVDLTFATFGSKQRQPQVIAIFDDMVVGGSLVLRDAQFEQRDRLHMKRVKADDVVMDVARAAQIENEGDKRKALSMIEESAKARGELDVANDAHYELRVLRSGDYDGLRRFADRFFYRGVAGYLVRPTRPLAVLVGIVLFAALVRSGARLIRGRTWSRPNWRQAPGAFGRGCTSLTRCVLETFERVSPRWSSERESLNLPERFELIAYRVLLVAAVIALANSNPTLREMVEALT
jgi:hypothetical protein